jgi:hypothetical protein
MYASFVEYSEKVFLNCSVEVECCFGYVWPPVWVMEKILKSIAEDECGSPLYCSPPVYQIRNPRTIDEVYCAGNSLRI